MVSPNFFTSVDTRRNILLLEASRKVVGAPDIALAVREHVWRWFASVGTTNVQQVIVVFRSSPSPQACGVVSAHLARAQYLLASVADAESREQREWLLVTVADRGECCGVVVCYHVWTGSAGRGMAGGRCNGKASESSSVSAHDDNAGVRAKIRRCNGALSKRFTVDSRTPAVSCFAQARTATVRRELATAPE